MTSTYPAFDPAKPYIVSGTPVKKQTYTGIGLYARTLGFQLIPYLLKSHSLDHLRRSSPTLPADPADSCSEKYDSENLHGALLNSQNPIMFITKELHTH